MKGVASKGPVACFDRFAAGSFSIPLVVAAFPRTPPSRSNNSSSFSSVLRLSSCVCPFNNPSTPLAGRKTDYAPAAARSRFLCGSGTAEETTMASEDAKDQRIARIASAIRVIPDFPKPGIIFRDITTLLLDHKAFKDTIDLFVERYKDQNISVIAGVEARGFIFGPPIALAIGAKFVPLRKPKKLPGEVISEEYSLEYGTDVMEMHVGAVNPGERALVIDDLIATGGTLGAAIRLLERVGAELVECACVIELPELEGWKRLGDKPLFVLVSAV